MVLQNAFFFSSQINKCWSNFYMGILQYIFLTDDTDDNQIAVSK